jgi:hypothetical protein
VGRKNKNPKQLAEARNKKRSSLIFPPLPLARELKVVLASTLCAVFLRSVTDSNGSQTHRIAYLQRLRFRSVSWLGGLSSVSELSSMTPKH